MPDADREQRLLEEIDVVLKRKRAELKNKYSLKKRRFWLLNWCLKRRLENWIFYPIMLSSTS